MLIAAWKIYDITFFPSEALNLRHNTNTKISHVKPIVWLKIVFVQGAITLNYLIGKEMFSGPLSKSLSTTLLSTSMEIADCSISCS